MGKVVRDTLSEEGMFDFLEKVLFDQSGSEGPQIRRPQLRTLLGTTLLQNRAHCFYCLGLPRFLHPWRKRVAELEGSKSPCN